MTSSILKYVTENELIWKDLVIRSEIETIKLLNKNAQIEFENQNPKFSECISKFLEIREKAIKNSYSSFIFFDTKYETTETKRDDYIRKLAKKFNDKSFKDYKDVSYINDLPTNGLFKRYKLCERLFKQTPLVNKRFLNSVLRRK